MLGYLSAGIGSRKAVGFEEQIMSKDKYPNIFSKSNGGLILCSVYYLSNIFASRTVLKIGK